MGGAVPPLPQYAIMAWCSVKAQEQIYLCRISAYVQEMYDQRFVICTNLL
jgi:hypothetical protein